MMGRINTVKRIARRDINAGCCKEEAMRVIDMFIDHDPSDNQKYLLWMYRAWINMMSSEEDLDASLDTIWDLVAEFHEFSSRMEKRDINCYASIQELERAVKPLRMKKTKREGKKGAHLIWKSPKGRHLLYHVVTQSAALYYGMETKWCISSREENHFESFIDWGDTFYFLIDRDADRRSDVHKVVIVVDRRTSGAVPAVFGAFDAKNVAGRPRNLILSQFNGGEGCTEDVCHLMITHTLCCDQ